MASPPSTYIANDPNRTVEDSFTVTAEAIPEFPTVIAGATGAGLCAAIYFWRRKKRLAHAQA